MNAQIELTPFEVECLRLAGPGRCLEWLDVDNSLEWRRFVDASKQLRHLGLVDNWANITDAGRVVLWALGVTW